MVEKWFEEGWDESIDIGTDGGQVLRGWRCGELWRAAQEQHKIYCDRNYELHTVGVAVGIHAPVLGETYVLVRLTDFTLIA